VANEVRQFFGIDKFRLGRVLWRRHRERLPAGRAAGGAAAGSGGGGGCGEAAAVPWDGPGGELEPGGAYPLDGVDEGPPTEAVVVLRPPAQRGTPGPQAMDRAGGGSGSGARKGAPPDAVGAARAAAAAALAAAASEARAQAKQQTRAARRAAEDDDGLDGGAAGHTAMFTLWVGPRGFKFALLPLGGRAAGCRA
jgi:hypothetical protein